ncbi:MAG: ABC transporter ATP-binding protein [Chloroflexi bacterium]|nr:ABC transporter ATP-binding protein [Chloroflexota bacterium]MBT4074274.1 ABC transporter ATP-binding protein [Chloroflexota bacterium]MBT4515270.1 ABC transporter ATP-binding protein [Chloroflexota bacterium]MBT5318315.1 ABC transporter ATP-binding protein [Chloroflexota bacterium]MBT6680960.1 ABC transporter ATP-binding protein [Chloroflexota bacterium]
MGTKNSVALAVQATGLEKSFGNAAVLRGLDMTVRDGEAVVIFGANGVGKSTLLRVLTTLTRPDYGSISIYGRDLSKQAEYARLSLGAVLHSPMLYGDMTIRENLNFFGKMFRVRDLPGRIEEMTDRLGLGPRMEQRTRELSHGYQKRAALARAMLHRPRILFLDEAETGLDEPARKVLDGVISEHRAAGHAVVMTTHSIERGIAESDRVFVLAGGRIALDAPSSHVTPNDVTGLYSDPSDA